MKKDSLLTLQVAESCSLNGTEPIRPGISEEETSASTTDLRIIFQQIHKTETHPLRRKCHVFESGLMLGQTWWQRGFENCREKPPFHWASLPARHPQRSIRTHRPALTPLPGSTESPFWASANTQFLSCPQGPSSLLSGQSLFPFRMPTKPDEFKLLGFMVPTDLSQALGVIWT